MKRLVFIVEGNTEILLVEKLIIPYLIQKTRLNISMHAQTITTNRKQHKKGGVSSYGKFRNEIERTIAQGNVIVTTMIDFYKLPTDFPYGLVEVSRLSDIEMAIHNDFDNNPLFLPYIQKHELEALMFSDISGFEFIIDNPDKLQEIEAIIKKYDNPEDINSRPELAPSKRMEKIFNYDKTVDGDMIFDIIKMDSILLKCPRFAEWIEKLIKILEKVSH